jgi:hypothetical protein
VAKRSIIDSHIREFCGDWCNRINTGPLPA